MQVKINGKEYEVKQLGFGDMAKMESIAGESIISVFQKQQMFVLALAFVANTADCSRDEAAHLCEQHIIGGGRLEDIYKVLVSVMNESAFFKKLLGAEEKTKKAPQKKAAAAAEQRPHTEKEIHLQK